MIQGRDIQLRAPARRRQSSAADILLASQLAKLTIKFPRANMLYVSAVDWELFILEDILRALSRTLTTITHLTLTRIKFRTFSHAAAFISAFPALRRVSMTEVSWDLNSTVTAAPSLALGQSLAVEVNSMQIVMHVRCLVEWLIVQNPLPIIHTFFMQVGFDEGNGVTRRLLQSALGPGIQTLHLSLRKFTNNEPINSEWPISLFSLFYTQMLSCRSHPRPRQLHEPARPPYPRDTPLVPSAPPHPYHRDHLPGARNVS